MVSPIQQKTTREIEIDKFITHRSWRKYTAGLEKSLEEVKGRCRQRGRQDLGHMPSSESVERVLWGSQAKVRLVNSNLKEKKRKPKPTKIVLNGYPR